jgi:hypothetical protein
MHLRYRTRTEREFCDEKRMDGMVIAGNHARCNERGSRLLDRLMTLSWQLDLSDVCYRFMEVGMNGKNGGLIAESSR